MFKAFVAFLLAFQGVIVLSILASIPAWVTHVVYCIQHEEWMFLVAGALLAPIGVIHGFGLWFGVW